MVLGPRVVLESIVELLVPLHLLFGLGFRVFLGLEEAILSPCRVAAGVVPVDLPADLELAE